ACTNFWSWTPRGLPVQTSFSPIVAGYRGKDSGYRLTRPSNWRVGLVMAWSMPEVRFLLLLALASHAAMRIWSFVDFIPQALLFERAKPETVDHALARAWTRRSRLRLALDVVTCFAMVSGFVAVVRNI